MHIISRKALKEAAKPHPQLESRLDAWVKSAEKAKWQSLEDVKQEYPSADGVSVGKKIFTVFNIGGNHFRLITKIEYRWQKIYIKHVLTHAEYDREEWKK